MKVMQLCYLKRFSAGPIYSFHICITLHTVFGNQNIICVVKFQNQHFQSLIDHK